MSIPDYVMTRTVIENHMRRQSQDTPDWTRPLEPAPERPGRLTALRHDLSEALHALASRVELRPDCTPGTAT
jgi:hypothetical protein